MQHTKGSISLWRRDTGQSYCFFAEQTVFDWGYHENDICFLCCAESKPRANTNAGLVARAMCHQNSINYLEPVILADLKPVFPSTDFTKEVAILNDNQGSQDSDLVVSSLKIDFRFSVGWDEFANDSVESEDHFLLFLDGLDWK